MTISKEHVDRFVSIGEENGVRVSSLHSHLSLQEQLQTRDTESHPSAVFQAVLSSAVRRTNDARQLVSRLGGIGEKLDVSPSGKTDAHVDQGGERYFRSRAIPIGTGWHRSLAGV